MNIQTLKNDKILSQILSLTDGNIYLVGGAVRDFLMGNESFDRDIIVEGISARDFARKLENFFNATFIPLDEVNNIYRVVLPDKINYFDITNPVENDLKKDLLRRDLTINSVAVNLKTDEIIDYSNGINDIRNRIIRGISEQNFIDDPLRLLRIFRFESLLGFSLSEDVKKIAAKHKDLIKIPAKERVQYEIMKLFCGFNSYQALISMDECSILEEIFPFIKELKQVPPNSHHHLNLFYHSLEAVKQLQMLYENSEDVIKTHMEKSDFGGFPRIAHLKLAGFMHDIGKFSCWTIETDTGRHRFFKHDEVGSKMCVDYLRNLKFSNKQISYIKTMIKNHIYPSMIVSAPDIADKNKVMMRYIRKMEDNSIDNILLAQADRLSARGPEITDELVNNNISNLNELLNFYLSKKDNLKPLPKLLDGKEIMEILNLKPSEKLGEVIKELNEEQLNGNVVTKEDALNFIKNLF